MNSQVQNNNNSRVEPKEGTAPSQARSPEVPSLNVSAGVTGPASNMDEMRKALSEERAKIYHEQQDVDPAASGLKIDHETFRKLVQSVTKDIP